MELYSDIISPPCQTVLLTARKLGITLNIKKIDLEDPADMATLTKVNPQHMIPTLVDGDHVLWESYAIAVYLVEKDGKNDSLYPKDPKVRSVVNQRLFFDIGTLYKNVLANLEEALANRKPSEEMVTKLKKALELAERFVTERPYAAADHLTIADVAMLSSITALGCWMQYDLEPYPGIRAWVSRVTPEFADYDAFKQELQEQTKLYIEKHPIPQ
ncbi:glutathione S-transferase 1-like [Anopheles aquasalis]|uniref:glutathione S-transferase 1-like n=1 Tax=Anopheles aquasalis TaxID=42839 RepID=UPI00215B49AA|nr:glutathione S-transferase 1-like [Anopheles aquasalis]